MATTIQRSNRSVDDFSSLNFYIFAPETRIQRGVFSKYLEKDNIRKQVKLRIDAYQNDAGRYEELLKWRDSYFEPVINKINPTEYFWEDIKNNVKNKDELQWKFLNDFYNKCLSFNKKKKQ